MNLFHTSPWASPMGVPHERVTKTSIVEMLQSNIDQYQEMKNDVIKFFVVNNDNIDKYTKKLKDAKQEHSRDFYGKKLRKYKAHAIGYLNQADQIDKFVESLQRSITKILAPEENTETVELPVTGEGPEVFDNIHLTKYSDDGVVGV